MHSWHQGVAETGAAKADGGLPSTDPAGLFHEPLRAQRRRRASLKNAARAPGHNAEERRGLSQADELRDELPPDKPLIGSRSRA